MSEESDDASYYRRLDTSTSSTPSLPRRIIHFFQNHILPKHITKDEERLALGPIQKFIRFRKPPYKLIVDLIILVCVLLVVCLYNM
jgi:hypothetical protein